MKEHLALLAVLGVAVASSVQLPFSDRQRRAILERDNHSCNAPFCHRCNPQRLEIHHVLGQRYLNRQGIDPDYPENAITLCSNAHDVIHPDRVQAREEYRQGNKEAFRRLGGERDERLRNREVPWNDEHDRKMQVVAVRNTQQAESKGWRFPWRRVQEERKNGKK